MTEKDSLSNHDKTLKRIIGLIEERTGLKATHLSLDVGDFLRQIGYASLEELLVNLEKGNENSSIWQKLIPHLTIGETYFLRDQSHFKILRQDILPKIIERRRSEQDKVLRLWCAGCATGEEAYSIATVLYESIPDIDTWQIDLFATDINEQSIQYAKQGIYREWSFRLTKAQFKDTYFKQIPMESGIGWQIRTRIQRMVTFARGNLLSHLPGIGFDVIFCRNVLLYLSNQQREAVETRLYHTLNHEGWLFLGQAEIVHTQRERWHYHVFPGTPVYQKTEDHTQRGKVAYHEKRLDSGVVISKIQPSLSDELNDAIQALVDEDFARAEQVISELLTHTPRHAMAHILLGVICANRHALPEARSHIEMALSIDAMLADAHYVQALVAYDENDIEFTQQALKATLYCDRDHVLALYMAGNLAYQKNEADRGKAYHRRALNLIIDFDDEQRVSDISPINAGEIRRLIDLTS